MLETVGDVLGGKMIFNYLEMYPNAHIHMIVENTRELLKKLDEGEIDFALVEGFFKKNEYDFQKYSELLPDRSPACTWYRLPEPPPKGLLNMHPWHR